MICKVNKQDGNVVIEEDEMKSIHSTTPLNLYNYYYLYLHILYHNPKNPKTNYQYTCYILMDTITLIRLFYN